MQASFDFKMKKLTQLILCAALVTAAQGAFADNVVDLGTVQSTATDDAVPSKDSAAYQAPTKGSLSATQPQSTLNQHYIQENASSGANYSDIVSIAPSVVSIDPNGPGMMENQALTMRGFKDGQFNVTFDGIPWGDSNDFTHHTTSYFMAQDLGNIEVDRGPGNASTIGYATSGGTIAVNSKDPMTAPTTTLYGSTGSYNSHLVGAEFDTGVMQNYGDTSAFIDYKNFTSDGFLTNTDQRRANLMMKFVKPLSDNTVLTFVTMQNKLHQNVSLGATQANINKYGYNYGLSNDPNRQDFAGYNHDEITADFEYVGLKSQLGDWKVDNKIYTYAYYHDGFNGGNNNGIGEPATNGTVVGGTTFAANVPGEKMNMNYRSWGDQLRLSEDLGRGKLDVGAWVDKQTNNRMMVEVDNTLGGAINTGGGAVGPNGIDRAMNDTLTTIQPYAQYEWKAMDALTVTPGVKYSSFTRSIDASVNQGSGMPYSGSQTWSKVLPSLDAHYVIQPNWTAYAQYAEGFLAPRLNTFYKGSPTTSVNASQMQTMQSKNFQIGTNWNSSRLSVAADVYDIHFDNENKAVGCGSQTCFQNTGAVAFNGVEGDATYVVGMGFSIYGNYTVNYNSLNNTASPLGDVPTHTAAAGLIYNQGPIYASLISKEVGQRYADVPDAAGNNILFSSYTLTNFNASYSFGNIGSFGKSAKIGFQVNNLFNASGNYAAMNTDASGNPLFYVIPGRNYQLNLSISM